MLPELTLSALARHLWIGAKASLIVTAICTIAYRAAEPLVNRQAIARLASGKDVFQDPEMTGSINKPEKQRSVYFELKGEIANPPPSSQR